jgi:hypothetical protein
MSRLARFAPAAAILMLTGCKPVDPPDHMKIPYPNVSVPSVNPQSQQERAQHEASLAIQKLNPPLRGAKPNADSTHP